MVLQLQRDYGNRYVQQLVQHAGNNAEAAAADRGTVQRQPIGPKTLDATLRDGRASAAPNWITPGNLSFATKSNGNFGSIYFNQGRIRLTHNSGPSVDQHAVVERYTVSEADMNLIKKYRKGLKDEDKDRYKKLRKYALTLGSIKPAVAGGKGKLAEFFGNQGARGWHPSRGGPEPLPVQLTQPDLNLLHSAASAHSNEALRAIMSADPKLSNIPVN